MLSKLIRYEWKAVARVCIPMYGGLILAAMLTHFLLGNLERFSSTLYDIITMAMSTLCFGLFMAAFVLTLIIQIQRFSKNLLGDEGYLMFTLPVSTAELICSKLIVSVVWFLGALAVDALGLLVTGRFGSYQNAVRFQVTYTFGMPMTGAQSAGLIIEFVAFLLLCSVALCLMTYAAMAIGQSFKKNKGLMSVVFFFVLWIGTRMLLTLIFGLLFGLGAQPLPAMTAMPLLKSMYILLGCGCAGALAFCAGFFFLTHGMLRRHLNMQ